MIIFLTGLILAGPAAEERFVGAAAGDSARVDWEMAAELACAVCRTEAEATAYLDRLGGRARAMVADPRIWAAIEVLALVLSSRRELRGQEVRRIYREAFGAVADALARA